MAISNLNRNTNTFGEWLDRTNEIIDVLNGFNTADNVTITGGNISGVTLDGSSITNTSANLNDLSLGTALAIGSGGTGGTTAEEARTNLEVLTEQEVLDAVQGEIITFAIALG